MLKERLKDYIRSKGMRISKFEKTIDASSGYVNNISKGIGETYLNRILEIYSDLSLEWLYTGKGNMLVTDDKWNFTEKEIGNLNDFVDAVIGSHPKLMTSEKYKLWFEVKCQKRAIQILKE